MHKIFGIKENEKYIHREGAYVIPVKGREIGVVKTPKGYFLLGGGLEEGERDTDCIRRECLEESGFRVLVKEKICSAESYTIHPLMGHFHPIQTYYRGELLEQVSEPTESDHGFCWVEYEQAKGNLFVEMQNWALEQAYESIPGK